MDQGPHLPQLSDGPSLTPAIAGERAARLAFLRALGLPVPEARVIPMAETAGLPARLAGEPALAAALIPPGSLVVLRWSPGDSAWGGPSAIAALGMCDALLPDLAGRIGEAAAHDLYARFIQSFAVAVERLDAGGFDELPPFRSGGTDAGAARARLAAAREHFEAETGSTFPQDPARQLATAVRAMLRDWRAPSARILRRASGAPEDAGIAMMVQDMILPLPGGASGRARISSFDPATGAPGLSGTWQAPGMVAVGIGGHPLAGAMQSLAAEVTAGLGDAFGLDIAVAGGELHLLDARRERRSARAAVAVAVALALRDDISRDQAILRIDPRHLVEHLHPQIAPGAVRDLIGSGMGASPGAAAGALVFTAEAAQARAAQGDACILVRNETSPEDIRGMQAASAVLTIRGGMTSHAAVIARGLGLPCVVGAGDLKLNAKRRLLTGSDGRQFREGDAITVDGASGQVLAGEVGMVRPELGGAYAALMEWADERRELGVRANADTPQDARLARSFRAEGIGLCRTEHMFFEADRINLMRDMILADSEAERRAALDRLLPIQRADFEELFAIMHGLPVTIRLLDPPLHEFLPTDSADMQELAQAMDMALADLAARAGALAEVNPMLGLRGVRLGVVMPEIYEMQARAIFEATLAVNAREAAPVEPEIMIPLVSANREVELVKGRIDAVARAIRQETGKDFSYRLGVMVETPRAALRAGDLARSSAFLSFGTNDLTQMTYGLSRDDSGRFMRAYVNQGVFPEDPFHTLDLEGVGELLLLAAQRGRDGNPGVVLGLCGEHGGDPASVRFCKLAGFDYVSCSPFRVPIARLAAAQATILLEKQGSTA